jgi:mycothiol synthase
MNGTGQTSSRCYGEEGDLALLRSFLSKLTAESPPQAYWHPGDLVWAMFQNTLFDPCESVRLWVSGGDLLGFAVLEDPNLVVMQVRPDLRGRGELEELMLSWAVERLDDRERNPGGEIWTRALESDLATAALLEERGFERNPNHVFNLMHQNLADAPMVRAPEGWSVRPVGGEEEWQQRVDLHREVWAPSKFTLEAYRRLRTVPGYDPGLDLVAAGTDGRLGSYCICWLDPRSRTGLFEPVGTSASYRRQGLGRAVIAEGLGRLRDSGAESAQILCVHGNDAALRLYESAGFRVVDKEYTYGRKLASFR